VLQVAGYLALNLADHVGASIGVSPVVEAGQVVAHVNVEGHTVAATAATSVTMLSWPGVSAHRALIGARKVRAGAQTGTRVGSVAVQLGTQREVIPVRLRQRLPRATMIQRLF
jgi:hypothetical protein